VRALCLGRGYSNPTLFDYACTAPRAPADSSRARPAQAGFNLTLPCLTTRAQPRGTAGGSSRALPWLAAQRVDKRMFRPIGAAQAETAQRCRAGGSSCSPGYEPPRGVLRCSKVQLLGRAA